MKTKFVIFSKYFEHIVYVHSYFEKYPLPRARQRPGGATKGGARGICFQKMGEQRLDVQSVLKIWQMMFSNVSICRVFKIYSVFMVLHGFPECACFFNGFAWLSMQLHGSHELAWFLCICTVFMNLHGFYKSSWFS